MSLEDAWTLYIEAGGKTVANRNRIVSILYGQLVERLTEQLHERYVDAMNSEIGVILVREIEHASRVISLEKLVTLVRRKPLDELDCPPGVDLIKLAESGMVECDEYHIDRDREAWKTGPDSPVVDPTIRFRPISAALIAAEKHLETARSESLLVRESSE